MFLIQVHLLDWQEVFVLHEQDKNPYLPKFFLIISRTENSTFYQLGQ
jgi:hypothetical protein